MEEIVCYADIHYPDGSITRNVKVETPNWDKIPKGMLITTGFGTEKSLVKCNCDIMLLMRVGCKCGGL